MTPVRLLAAAGMLWAGAGRIQADPPAFPEDPASHLERTSFQTSKPWSEQGNLRADVAMVYGIDDTLPDRLRSWRDRGYRVHLMTGVSWGEYQDYLYGRFDGINHEDNAQTDRNGRKISHGGDVYYMCPAENFGEYLSVGVQKALDAGVDAVHLEEPEFWARAGYSEGFKREWQAYYQEPWQPPHSSVDAQWRSSKLKYYLYQRALRQVFNHVQEFNRRTGRKVRCYVPTHSLINYAHWCIVSPESSLAKIDGCDGYIAQVWTGTARTPNHYRGVRKERTFETAFLEYGAMQNLVRATGRSVWYLNDPVEDNPRHDWTDYRVNWESTLTASLLQPDVWKFEVAPWPERVFGGRYPRSARRADRKSIPPEYATELQVVMQALNDMNQPDVRWDCGTRGIGFLISDSLMFQREQPTPSDPNMAHLYGLALPLVKRGMPLTPVQLENVGLDESVEAPPHQLEGRFVNLFDPDLQVQRSITLTPSTRVLLLDLDAVASDDTKLLASACKALRKPWEGGALAWSVEGVGSTSAIVLIATRKAPRSIELEGTPVESFAYDPEEGLLRIRFPNESRPRDLVVAF